MKILGLNPFYQLILKNNAFPGKAQVRMKPHLVERHFRGFVSCLDQGFKGEYRFVFLTISKVD